MLGAVCTVLPLRQTPPRPVCKWPSMKPGPIAFPSAISSLFHFISTITTKKGKRRKKQKQKFIPVCISALCNDAKHFSFIIIIPVKGTLNNVNARGKPLGFYFHGSFKLILHSEYKVGRSQSSVLPF